MLVSFTDSEQFASEREKIVREASHDYLNVSYLKSVEGRDHLLVEFQRCAGWGGQSGSDLFAILTSLFTHPGIHVAFKDCHLESLEPLHVDRLCSLRGEGLTVDDMPALPPRFLVGFTKGWPGAAAIPDALADGKRLAQA
jgi:hypothetical protein